MNRIRLHRTQAIVLRRHDLGEADRILTLLTPDRGKVRAVAKGVRRIASRKRGHVELFSHIDVVLGKGRNLEILTQADLIQPFLRLRDDLVRTAYAYHLAELADRFAEEDVANPALFERVRDGLGALEEAPDPSLALRYFELRLLALAGYRPELFRCASCGGEVRASGTAFSPDAGGAVCITCAPRVRDAQVMPEAAFKVLRYLQRCSWPEAAGLAISPPTRGALERLMQGYLRHLLERDLASVGFLGALRANAGLLGLEGPPAGGPAPTDEATTLPSTLAIPAAAS